MDIRSTLTEICAAFNAHDLDRIMAFFAEAERARSTGDAL
jgi:hypothetical protein